MRAQTSLPALGIALVLLVSTTAFALTVADEQRRADRGAALERESAMSVADALVAADAGVTKRANVVDPAALSNLSAADLETRYGLEATAGVSVRLDGRPLLRRGTVTDGRTVERIVLVENRTSRRLTPAFSATHNVTLPRRTPTVTLDVSPGPNASVEVVRANGRVVLENPAGITGTTSVDVSRYRTVTLGFEGSGNLSRGDVRVSYRPARTRKVTLSVTVQRRGGSDG